MRFSVQLLDSDSSIRSSILNSLIGEVDSLLNKSIPAIRSRVIALLADAMRQEPEYNALRSGRLRSELGIPDAGAVEDIVNKLANTLAVTKNAIRATSAGLSGGLTLYAIESSSFNGLLSDPSAMVNDTTRGYSLPWLEWILLRGNQTIVKKYDVKFGPNPGSRTGDAIMVESNNSWRVPAEFAGTKNNNWTTRAIDRIEKTLSSEIKKILEQNI